MWNEKGGVMASSGSAGDRGGASRVIGALAVALTLAASASAARVVEWVQDDISFAGRTVANVTEKIPRLDAISPGVAELGSPAPITITGRHFDMGWTFSARLQSGGPVIMPTAVVAPGGASLTFSGADPAFPGAGTYDLYFATTGRKSNSLRLVLSVNGGPALVEVDPIVGGPEDTITLRGLRFGSLQGVIHSSSPVDPDPPVLSWEVDGTAATFAVPSTWSIPQSFELWIADSLGRTSNRLPFRTAKLRPVLNTVSPSTAQPGAFVILRGLRFGAVQGEVVFHAAGASEQLVTPVQWTDRLVRFEVPPAAPLPTTAEVRVQLADGTRTNARLLDVVDATSPRIISVAPSSAPHENPIDVSVTGQALVSPLFGGLTTFTFILGTDRYVAFASALTPTSVTLTTPMVPTTGWADLEVVVEGAGSHVKPSCFYFEPTPAPRLDSLAPQLVSQWGNDAVTIHGDFLTPAPEVFVDGVLVSSEPVSDEELVFTTQYHLAGPVLVEVRRAGDPTRATIWGDDAGEPPLTFVHGAWFGDFYVSGTGGMTMRSATWADFSGEGWNDVVLCGDVADYNETRLITATGQKPVNDVSDVTRLGTGLPGAYRGATWGDVNNDGTLDAFLVRDVPSGLLYVDPAAIPGYQFSDVTTTWFGPSGAPVVRAAAFLDFDRDGRLDLFVAKSGSSALYRNVGGSFVDVTVTAGVGAAASGVALATQDLDGDLYPDIVVVSDGSENVVYRNRQDGTFENVSSSTGLCTTLGSHTSIAFDDYDMDGVLDAYVTALGGGSLLYHGLGPLSFEVAASQPESASLDSQDAAWADADGDGDPELFVASEGSGNSHVHYRLQQHAGAWLELTPNNVAGLTMPQDVAVADYPPTSDSTWQSSPGTPDLLYAQDTEGHMNRFSWVGINTDPSAEWMRVRLRGTTSNPAAIGASVRLDAAGSSITRQLEAASGNELGQSFWFASPTTPDRLTVRWPGGMEQVFQGASLAPLRNATTLLTEPKQRIFLTQSTPGLLEDYNPMTGALLWSLAVGSSPTRVAVREQGDEALVVVNVALLGKAIQQVSVPSESLPGAPAVVGTISLGTTSEIRGLAVRPGGSQLVVLRQETAFATTLETWDRGTVQACTPTCHYPWTFTRSWSIPSATLPSQLVLDPSGRYAYVVVNSASRVDWIDLDDPLGTHRGSIPMPGILGQVAFEPSGDAFVIGSVVSTLATPPIGPPQFRNLPFVRRYRITGGDPATATLDGDVRLSDWNEASSVGWVRHDTSRRSAVAFVAWTSSAAEALEIDFATLTTTHLTGPVGSVDGEIGAGRRLWSLDAAGQRALTFDLLDRAQQAQIPSLVGPADLVVGNARP